MKIWPTKRRWKRIAIVLGMLVAVALIANALMAWRTNRHLQARIDSIRAAGDPASIADLAPRKIPDEQNAAAILHGLGPRLDAFSKEYGKLSETPLIEDFDKRLDSGEPATAEQIAAVRAVLDQFPDIGQGLAAAAACDEYASVNDFSLDHQAFLEGMLRQQAGRIRTAARYLQWRSAVLLSEGKQEEAVQDALEVLRIARLYDGEPLLVNLLVGIAVRGVAVNMLYDALAAGPVTPEVHAAVEKELAFHDTPRRIEHALKTDRAYSLDVARDAGMGKILQPQLPWYFQLVAWPMKRQFGRASEYFDEQIALVVKSWPNANKQIGRTGGLKASDFGVLAELLLPALQAAYDAEARVVGTMRGLRIFNALAAYRTKNNREATGLADLALPTDATLDPFSGNPLLLKHTSEGWVVYSVMKNGVDDGGDFKEMKDYGVAPRKLRATE